MPPNSSIPGSRPTESATSITSSRADTSGKSGAAPSSSSRRCSSPPTQPQNSSREKPMNRLRIVLCTLATLLCAVAAGAQGTFYLKNGDHVVFYGDSITEQRLYTSFVETYVVTRFPKLN